MIVDLQVKPVNSPPFQLQLQVRHYASYHVQKIKHEYYFLEIPENAPLQLHPELLIDSAMLKLVHGEFILELECLDRSENPLRFSGECLEVKFRDDFPKPQLD
ncbi:MAG: hypothetical protein AAFO04_29805 [Cyanobacteria bacterium J06592_8]